MTNSKWYIRDWASDKPLFDGKTFDSFEEARDFISEYADKMAKQEVDRYNAIPSMENHQMTEDEIYNGICEDLYTEPVKE